MIKKINIIVSKDLDSAEARSVLAYYRQYKVGMFSIEELSTTLEKLAEMYRVTKIFRE